MRRHRRTITWCTLIMAASMGLDVMVPWLIGRIIDAAIANRDVTQLAILCGAYLLLCAVSYIAWRLVFIGRSRLTAIEHNIQRLQVSGRLLDAHKNTVPHTAGDILTISSTDVRRVPQVLALFLRSLPNLVSLLVALVLLLSINWVLCLVAFVGAIATGTILRLLAPTMIAYNTTQQRAVGHTSATASDLIKGIRVIQGIGMQAAAMRRYETSSRASLKAALANARVSGWNAGSSSIVAALILGLLSGLAGHLAMRSTGGLSIGNFVTVLGICQMLARPLGSLGESSVIWAQAKSSAQRVSGLLKYRLVTPPQPEQPFTGGDLTVTGALNFTAPAGHITAIVCPQPPLIADLLTALTAYGAPQFIVHYGTLNTRHVSPLDLRHHVLAEPHHTELFEGTLREAVALGRPDNVNDDDVLQALEWAGARDIVDAMSDALDSRLLDRGSNLSGGQRQRVGLARALFAQRKVLLLEDPTTAVDSVTEQAIARGLPAARAHSDFVTVIFTTAPALLEAADHVVFVAHDGAGLHTAVTGTHHELLHTNPAYAQEVQR